MKTRFIICLLLIFGSTRVNSQNAGWSKEDRTSIYNECMNNISKYPNLTIEQRESICLCYVTKVTKDYDKQSYQKFNGY